MFIKYLSGLGASLVTFAGMRIGIFGFDVIELYSTNSNDYIKGCYYDNISIARNILRDVGIYQIYYYQHIIDEDCHIVKYLEPVIQTRMSFRPMTIIHISANDDRTIINSKLSNKNNKTKLW